MPRHICTYFLFYVTSSTDLRYICHFQTHPDSTLITVSAALYPYDIHVGIRLSPVIPDIVLVIVIQLYTTYPHCIPNVYHVYLLNIHIKFYCWL